MTQRQAGTARDIGRMEAFSDAVFAIGITLPIVEIEMPEVGPDGADLARALAQSWPSYLGYILSFFVIGVYWLRHHFAGKLYVQADHTFNLLNLVFLMAVCFVPFPTRVFVEHLGNTAQLPVASAFYLAALLLPAAAWTLKWIYGAQAGMIDHRLDPAYIRRLTTRYVATAGAYAAALLMASLDYRLGLAIGFVVTLIYLLPPPAPIFAEATRTPSV